MPSKNRPILIIGAGINGCAVARELVSNGISVVIVEKYDIGWGATSRSSRLIHGGVRYLEYGEFRLVRESLDERTRLLKNAPHFVRPLTLNIPVRSRFGGLAYSVLRFLSAWRIPLVGRMAEWFSKSSERGVWLVRSGLWMYDRYTRGSGAPRHTSMTLPAKNVPQIDAERYRWVCQYMDAQILFPERLILSMLKDCETAVHSSESEHEFFVHNNATAVWSGNGVFKIERQGEAISSIEPAMVINATGAWGDLTMADMPVKKVARMFGGTKGSHLITHQEKLRSALGDGGIYAEASDGRLIFILPFGDSVMVGTTDVRFEQDPGEAIASPEEVDYLIEMVNTVLPAAELTRADVEMHYSGVRPLPFRKKGSTAAISRDHSIRKHKLEGITTLTLIGGKLTTCRAFGELVADKVFEELQVARKRSTIDLAYSGGDSYPSEKDLAGELQRIAAATGFSDSQVRVVWRLVGSEAESVLSQSKEGGTDSLVGTEIPVAFVHAVIENEWVMSLDDLIERRLMLLYDESISAATLSALADLLIAHKILSPDSKSREIERTTARLQKYYGRQIAT